MSIEAGIDRLELHKCTNEQRGPDDQDQRERHFGHDQDGTKLPAAKANAGTTAALVERGGKVGTRRADGGDQTEENPGDERHAERK